MISVFGCGCTRYGHAAVDLRGDSTVCVQAILLCENEWKMERRVAEINYNNCCRLLLHGQCSRLDQGSGSLSGRYTIIVRPGRQYSEHGPVRDPGDRNLVGIRPVRGRAVSMPARYLPLIGRSDPRPHRCRPGPCQYSAGWSPQQASAVR